MKIFIQKFAINHQQFFFYLEIGIAVNEFYFPLSTTILHFLPYEVKCGSKKTLVKFSHRRRPHRCFFVT